MPKIDDLRRDRQAAATKLQDAADAIAALEDAGTGPDEDAHKEAVAGFDAAQAEFDTLNAQVKRAEAAEAARAAAAVGDQGATAIPAPRPAVAADPDQKGVGLGFMVHALARCRGDRDKAASYLDAEGHSGISAALSGASETAGGVTIPRPLAQEMIELLRSRVVVRRAGARTFPMPAGQIRHSKQTASATASYGAENAQIAPSEPEFDKLDQSFKKLTGLVPVGNSLLRHSGMAMAQHVRDDLLKVMARREDLAFIRGTGTANTPRGIRNWLLAANWIAATDAGIAASSAAAEAALRTVVSRVEDADVNMSQAGWIMRASAKNFLANLRDDNGNKLFPSIEANGQLLGWPIHITSQIPNNLGSGGDETEIYFGEFSEAMIGDSMDLSIGVSTEAGYFDGTEWVSAFQNDLTLMRAISEHDFALEHDVAFAGFNAAGWSL
ncbi:phage major capsid protein [Paracoccus seriniphilus]|uniref:Phage major capsid protein, HK97 family n=1 Tax=Paracoccus seriniphilus TaxID=184748 RepID=A0A239Q283_9RHOB|nr:phage major capsid protein [Paracoccus seriniphilus]WCR13226.1 phage major capsid protein [Paracoccus seriniphilus]SNT76719.1 phage major capsid protein, HK97 family [Paracoccus seriniphilus]